MFPRSSLFYRDMVRFSMCQFISFVSQTLFSYPNEVEGILTEVPVFHSICLSV